MTLVATALARPPMLMATDLTLTPGTLTGLVGPNGAGKTTLLRALAGLSRGPGMVTLADQGSVVADLPATLRPRSLAWLPADRDVPWPITAADLVQLGLGPDAPPDPQAVAVALALADAAAFATRRVNALSTGERARVLLARALVARPAWLLLDEPVANLDPAHRLAVIALLRAEAMRGAGVIASLHDLDLARAFDRLLLIADGTIVAEGPPADVLSPACLAAVFGVRRDAEGWALA